MNPFKSFDKVYCLNLASRQDRWQECLSNFENYSIDNYERFEAIRVAEGVYENISQKRLGQISCALSFCSMIDEAINRGLNSVVFLEDDFQFVSELQEFNQKLQVCLNELPENWDMFYLGANVINEIIEKPLSTYSENLLKLNSGYALHSVAISRAGLLKIKDYFRDSSFKFWGFEMINKYEAIDIFFAQTFQPNNNCFIGKELLATQRGCFSSIEGTFFDYSSIMSERFNYFKSII